PVTSANDRRVATGGLVSSRCDWEFLARPSLAVCPFPPRPSMPDEMVLMTTDASPGKAPAVGISTRRRIVGSVILALGVAGSALLAAAPLPRLRHPGCSVRSR